MQPGSSRKRETRRAIEFYEQRLAIARENRRPPDRRQRALELEPRPHDKLEVGAEAIARSQAALQIFQAIRRP